MLCQPLQVMIFLVVESFLFIFKVVPTDCGALNNRKDDTSFIAVSVDVMRRTASWFSTEAKKKVLTV